MEVISVEYFSDTSKVILVEEGTVYFDIRNSSGKSITDNAMFDVHMINNYSVISLYKANFSMSDFPLTIVTFKQGETAYTELFNAPFSIPSSTSRFAFGKRGDSAKNITFENLTDYCNDGGECYVEKSANLSDILPSAARENLSVYDKNFINNIGSNYVTNSNNTNFIHSTATDYPMYSSYSGTSESGTKCQEVWENYFNSGVAHISFKLSGVKYIKQTGNQPLILNGAHTDSLFNGRELYPKSAMIMYPSFSGTNRDGVAYQWYPDPQWLPEVVYIRGVVGAYDLDVPEHLPVIIVTGDEPFVYRGSQLDGQSIYMYWKMPDFSSHQDGKTPYIELDEATDITFRADYVPSDAQL